MSEIRPDVADWIGSSETVDDVLTPRLATAFGAMFATGGSTSLGEPVTGAIHWCLAPSIVPTAELDSDGHIRRGGFLPPVDLKQRMWAGSRTTFHDALRVGDTVSRNSVVSSIENKQGKSGALCFVEIDHEFRTARGLAVAERQTVVYRNADQPPIAQPGPDHGAGDGFVFDAVTLFRYSALTFNSHRIHYDLAYARDVEHYPGLVVHGPLQASWLLDRIVREAGMPRSFSFKGVAPLIAGRGVTIRSQSTGSERQFEIVDSRGTVTLKAVAA